MLFVVNTLERITETFGRKQHIEEFRCGNPVAIEADSEADAISKVLQAFGYPNSFVHGNTVITPLEDWSTTYCEIHHTVERLELL